VARLKARPDTNLHFCTTLCRSANHVSQTTFDICETHSPGAARKVRGRSFQLPCASGLRPRRWNSAPRQGSPPCLVVRCEVTLLFHHRRLSRWQTGETPVSPSNRYETHIRVSIGWLSPRRPAPFIVRGRERPPTRSISGQGTGSHGRACTPMRIRTSQSVSVQRVARQRSIRDQSPLAL
jgi:hypothetical protein